MVTQEVTINNEVGLHARPATFFIQKANEFKSGIWVEKEERRVNAKSLLGVLSLGIVKGTTITLIADGPDAKEAVEAISDMDLRDLFIVSSCLIAEDEVQDDAAVTGVGSSNPGLHIAVKEAPGVKCPRCWMHSTAADPETGLCPRCASVVAKLD